MDTILVIDAEASSVGFQTFAVQGEGRLRLHATGMIDGVGTRPRFRVSRANGDVLVNRAYPVGNVRGVSAAFEVVAAWLRDELGMRPLAVGHRLVRGAHDYDRPVLIDLIVMSHLERLADLGPLHQSHGLEPIRSFLASDPALPQVLCFDRAEDHYMVARHTLALLLSEHSRHMPSPDRFS
jgi:acetate kinase